MYDKGKNSGTLLFYVAGLGIMIFLALLIYSHYHPESLQDQEPETVVVPEPAPEPDDELTEFEKMEREIIEAEEGEQEVLGEITFDMIFGECDSPGKPYPF